MFGRRLTQDMAGVIDENVDPGNVRGELREEIVDGPAIPKVAPVSPKCASASRNFFPDFTSPGFERAADAGDVGPGFSESYCHGSADSAPAPGYDRGPAIQPE
jgi:hypothetical protein